MFPCLAWPYSRKDLSPNSWKECNYSELLAKGVGCGLKKTIRPSAVLAATYLSTRNSENRPFNQITHTNVPLDINVRLYRKYNVIFLPRFHFQIGYIYKCF